MAYSENTHVTFTDTAGKDVVGIVKGFGGGKYSIQTKNSDTVSVDEGKVSELKVTDPGACPVAGK